jgi:hypothetical protein
MYLEIGSIRIFRKSATCAVEAGVLTCWLTIAEVL